MGGLSGVVRATATMAIICLGVAACGSSPPGTGVTGSTRTSAAGAASASGGLATATPAGGPPAIGASAFTGHGRLAFVSGDRLYVLDGTAADKPATLHLVTKDQVPGSPTWSADGRWLAFLVGTPDADGAMTNGALWLAGPDGQSAHLVLGNVSGFGWSPKADELAAVSGDTLFTVRPGQAARSVIRAPGLTGPPAWSPDGTRIAVSFVERDAQRQFTGGELAYVEPGTSSAGIISVAHSTSDALLVDGWWPSGQGLFAWQDPQDSASLAADGVPVGSYALGGGVKILPSTLVHQSFAVPSWGGVTLVTGGDRYLWDAKTLTLCLTSGSCLAAMNATPAPVNLDPAWSPNSEPTLAFVHAAPSPSVGFSQQILNAWYRTRQLWYWAGTGGNPLPVPRAGTGVAAPVWSANGQDILYVRDNALWLIPMFAATGMPASGPATEIVGALFQGDWPNFYGYTDWQSQFAWQS
jgi:hypothetical protein